MPPTVPNMLPSVGCRRCTFIQCHVRNANKKTNDQQTNQPTNNQTGDSKAWLWLALDGGLVVSGGLLLMTIATQHILSSEAALIGLLELLFGPLFVFFGVGKCAIF